MLNVGCRRGIQPHPTNDTPHPGKAKGANNRPEVAYSRDMIATLAALVVAQTIPASAQVIYPGIPESPMATQVTMVTHSVTYTLEKDRVTMESTTGLKNTSNRPVSIDLVLPVRGRHVNWAQSQGMRQSATINGTPVALRLGPIERTEPSKADKAKGVWAMHFARLDRTTVNFKAGETKSLKVKFTAPIGRAGLDGVQRMVVYDTAGGDNWNGPVGQFNYAIKYTSDLVLGVYAALPEQGWQIGQTGAFRRIVNFTPAENSVLIFTYYPGGFDRIGGG